MTLRSCPAADAISCVYRAAVAADAPALEALISAHRDEGHLLPREQEEIRAHAGQFVVAEVDGEIRACAALVPLSSRMAEVRSLVVAPELRRHGVAAHLVAELKARAERMGARSLLALAHDPRFFMRHDFSIVPHEWLPEKIARDCHACPLFRRCGQHAMLLSLDVRRPELASAPPGPTAAVA